MGRGNGKVVIVTGGTYGIGRSITRVLSERGYRVVAFGLESRQVGSTAERGIDGTKAVLDSLGLHADLLEGDVTRKADVDRIVRFALEKYGKIDGLVNNAAIHPFGKLLETDDAIFEKVVEVNLKGAFLMMRAVMPHMIRQGGGSIVNVGSGSQWGRGNLAAYCASKGGLYALTMATAYDYIHDHIRLNMVIPGGAPVTGMTEFMPGIQNAGLQTVTGRNTEPEEVAFAVEFLLSDDARQNSGTIIDVGCFAHQGGPVMPRQQSAARAPVPNGMQQAGTR
ncbi:MAG: SDR family oxidoreductase [SAR202 cluster bacterium]|nr:SDR family oxidoreductase [SAR202 cluster bacterium]